MFCKFNFVSKSWMKNSWKCCGFGHHSCWQLWFHEKNCQKNLGEKLVKMLGFCQNFKFFEQKFDFYNSVNFYSAFFWKTCFWKECLKFLHGKKLGQTYLKKKQGSKGGKNQNRLKTFFLETLPSFRDTKETLAKIIFRLLLSFFIVTWEKGPFDLWTQKRTNKSHLK